MGIFSLFVGTKRKPVRRVIEIGEYKLLEAIYVLSDHSMDDVFEVGLIPEMVDEIRAHVNDYIVVGLRKKRTINL